MSGLGETPSLAMIMSTFDVSRETAERLDSYVDALRKWTRSINLVSKASVPDIWTRHILDSAQLFPLRPNGLRHWADLGAGGGLPGVVCAILLNEHDPSVKVSLVESDKRKGAFLASVIRDLSLSAKVVTQRAERATPLQADLITARALTALPDLLALAAPHLAPHGRMLFPKGAQYAQEISHAQEVWRFTIALHPSITDSRGRIIECSALHRLTEGRPS